MNSKTKKKFKMLHLPDMTIQKLQLIKIAFGYNEGEMMTYEKLIERLINGTAVSEPQVYRIYQKLKKSN